MNDDATPAHGPEGHRDGDEERGDRGAVRYANASQQRLIAVLEALAASPFDGVDLDNLRTAANCSRDQAYRAARNLELAGWAEPAPNGGWRTTPRAAYVAERVRLALADLHVRYLGAGT